MKKILFFIPTLSSGGAERVIVTLANNWCEYIDVHILTLLNIPSFYKLNPSVKHIKMDLPLPTKGLKRLIFLLWINWKRIRYFINHLKENKIDTVIAFTVGSTLIACLGKLLYRKFSLLVSERNDPTKKSWLFLSLCRLSDGIICQNEFSKNFYIKKGFKVPISVLPNPVNFEYLPKEPTNIKRREIVTVGRLTEQKNHKLLIDAFSEISNEYPEYILKIYGVGNLENNLKQQIKNLKLENKVFLMGTKKGVMFDVQQSDIFVLSSNFEGFPNVLIEAMACGMPVISSDFATGIARQLIKNGENGFLFQVGNKLALVNTLKNMLNNKYRWIKMGQKNREIAKQYEVENVSKKWLSTIADMLSEKM